MTVPSDPNREADRSAWLEAHQGDIEHLIGSNIPADTYWAEIEKTFGWAAFILGRRWSELVAAVVAAFKTEGENR